MRNARVLAFSELNVKIGARDYNSEAALVDQPSMPDVLKRSRGGCRERARRMRKEAYLRREKGTGVPIHATENAAAQTAVTQAINGAAQQAAESAAAQTAAINAAAQRAAEVAAVQIAAIHAAEQQVIESAAEQTAAKYMQIAAINQSTGA